MNRRDELPISWRDDLRRDPDWMRAAYMVGVVAFIGLTWGAVLWVAVR